MTTPLTLEVGQKVVIAGHGPSLTVESIAGRWVKLSNGKNISRAGALEGLETYLKEQAELEADEGGDEEGGSMSETVAKYRLGYVKVVSYSGNNSLDNGDDVAEILRGMSPDETCALADKVFEAPAFHHAERWQHLNAGSRRMNAGNRIRAAFKRGEVTAQQLRDYADHKDIKLDEGEV